MQVGNILIKIVPRKLQNNERAVQYMVLAGFNPKMGHTTADFYETLSPTHVLKKAEIEAVIAKLQKLAGAKGYDDVTHDGVWKKLNKVFDGEGSFAATGTFKEQTWAQMGIGRYKV